MSKLDQTEASAPACRRAEALELAQASAHADFERTVSARDGVAMGAASRALAAIAHERGEWPAFFLQRYLALSSHGEHLASFLLDAQLCTAELWLAGRDGFVRALEMTEQVRAIAERYGSAHGHAFARLLAGQRALLSGQLAVAETELQLALTLQDTLATRDMETLTWLRLAEVAFARGLLAQAQARVARSRLLLPKTSRPSDFALRVARVQLDRTDRRGALAPALLESSALVSEPAACELCSNTLRLITVIHIARAGDVALATSQLQEAQRVAARWPNHPWDAALWEARAALRSAQGQHAQAEALRREALDLHTQAGRLLDAERCRTR